MKAYRILYWAVMLGALLYGLYSGERFPWLLFLIQALVLIAALCINIWTAWSFSYVQELSESQGTKGQTVGLHIGIYNDKPFPFTRMKVTVEAPDPAETQTLNIDLAPHADCSFDLRLGLPMRGEFLVGMTRLDLQDVFGLLPMHFDLRRLPYYRQKPLLVLPRVRDFSLPSGGAAQRLGNGLSAGSGQEELSHLRDWQPGDRLSRVHWAATAKTRTLLSRQYEEPAGGSVLLFLDCRTLSDPSADLLTECAATLLYAHLCRGDQADVRTDSPHALPPERAFSLSGLSSLRQWLALLKFDQPKPNREDFVQAVRGEAYSKTYVLGGSFDPKILQLLETLDAPCCYWLLEPLPGGAVSRRVNLVSLGHEDLCEFLYKHLGGEP